MVLLVKCSVVFHLQFFLNNYVSYRYVQLSLGIRVATFLRNGCQLACLVLFVAV